MLDLRIRLYRGQGGLTARVRMLDAQGVTWRTYLLRNDGETVTLSHVQEQAAQHARDSLQKIHNGRVPAHEHQLMMEIDMAKKGDTSRCGQCLAYLPTQESEEGTCWESGAKMLAGAVACGKFKLKADYPILAVREPR
ncbi:hypothetical protein [Oceanidesulfovibrio marinus]|uniref:Uncharacterized protein n=1 Tax=Oceanidesulfovibrio marinus TaxID=370038 RepID=A0A6P1ZKL5_9BACT|nr:hypothetical protein [Oceanidesulfovibrio marinus]TVM35634.1 hypothetical protein DQK91_02920 [Oceanidesulfovibrio marinus]